MNQILRRVVDPKTGDYVAEVVATYAGPPPTVDDVVHERERRLGLGFDHDFGDKRGVHRIGTTPDDMRGWEEVTQAATAAVALGQPMLPIAIVTDTGPVVITAAEWQAVLLHAAQVRQPIWAASFALQALAPIPADYADDARWM